MYSFIDINETPDSVQLPAEAMEYDGEYLENLIPGYRTLYVSGREAIVPDLTLTQTGMRDGSVLNGRRYPERKITVGYQLIAESNAAFREAYNQLIYALRKENVVLIFRDEPDKFFRGTLSGMESPPAGRNAIVSELEFTCPDPYKYSVTEYEINAQVPDGGSLPVFVTDYHGTFPSHPILETQFYMEDEADSAITGNGDCGFVSFMDQNENVLQFGNPEEPDGSTSETLAVQDIKNAKTNIPATGWQTNVGRPSDPDGIAMTGTIGETGTYKRLCAGNYGSSTKNWHGPFFTKTLPAARDGSLGTTNFRFTVKNRFAISNNDAKTGQREHGGFQVLLVNVNENTRTIVAGIAVYKNADGTHANVHLYHYGSKHQVLTNYSVAYGNKHWGFQKDPESNKEISRLATTIKAQDGKYTFVIGGQKTVISVTGKPLPVHEITLGFIQHKTKPPMGYNYCLSYKFIKDDCEWENIPNIFSAQDVLTVDTAEGEVLLNNANAPELGALGNDWEEFVLVPGVNQIGCAYSDWVGDEYAPTFKMRYREVFL